MRYDPAKGKLERTAQYSIPNPWGIAFDEWGQNFFLHTSGPKLSWMQQAAVAPKYNVNIEAPDLITSNSVRPAFKGAKQHKIEEDTVNGGYKTSYRHDLFSTQHGNFRPVDLEFAPDGSLFFIDWHNPLIGHMQHSARDPHRDHTHGRVYRVTYPSRDLVKPAKIDGASITELLDNLKLPEYRTRYRTRRELRGRNVDEVATAITKWVAGLDTSDKKYEHHMLEALWVSWGINKIDKTLVTQLLSATDHRARAAAVRAVRYNLDKISDGVSLIKTAANDKHSLVRTEAVVAASWIGGEDCKVIIANAKKQPVLKSMKSAMGYGLAHGTGGTYTPPAPPKVNVPAHVKGRMLKRSYVRGKHLYEGPIQVKGVEYNLPMPGFANRVNNKDIADMLTYIRNAWSNKNGDGYTAEEVTKIQEENKNQEGMHKAADLLKQHPLKGN